MNDIWSTTCEWMNMMDGFFFISSLLVIVDGAREGEKEKKRRGVLKNKTPRALLWRKNFT